MSCESESLKETTLHKSLSVQASNVISKTQELFTEEKNFKGTKPEHVIQILEPVMETEFKTSMKSTVKNQVNKNKEANKRKKINK